MKISRILLSLALITVLLCGCVSADKTTDTNSESAVVSTNNSSKVDSDDLLKDFISSKAYLEYTSSYNGECELSYAIFDINNDGTNELLINADEGTGFNNSWLFAIDNNKITLVKEHYGFGTFRYSQAQDAIILPPEFRPFIGASYYEFCTLTQNKLDIKFVIGADPDDQSPQREKYYYKTSDTKKDITSDEFMAYFNDTVSFEWTKIDSK
ncbi:MAG: hypothetical protein IKK65_02970 [Clostridia bacterium]|nr:hypothetical protein [Clostridia bacterium]MBR4117020.1 hypothetical protein [Clostridia bacterium]